MSWDEVPPGGGADPQQQQMQKLMQLFNRIGTGPDKPQQQPQSGLVSPGQAGQVPQMGQPPQTGDPNMRPSLPQAILPGSTEGGPGRYGPPKDVSVSDTSFQNKGARNAATVRNAVSGISQAVMGYKQQQHDKKVQSAKAAMMENVMQSMDPQSQQQLDKMAKSDPKMAKIIEKKKADFSKMYEKAMTDPNSPEYYGFQQAYKDLSAQAQLRDQMELAKAQIQEAQSKGKQADAEAGLAKRKTELEGTVTPAIAAQQKTEIDKANIQAQAQKDHWDRYIKAQTDRTNAMMEIARERSKYMKAALGQKTGDKTLDSLAKEYTNINQQLNGINSQYKTLQQDIKDHPLKDFFNTKHIQGIHTKMSGLDAQRDALTQQLKAIEQKRQVMLKVGVIPPQADGSEGPMVITPDMMNGGQQ